MKKQGGCGVSRDGGRLWGRTGRKYRPRSGAMASLRGRDGRLWEKKNGDGGRFRSFRRQYLVNKYKAKKRGRHEWIASISMIFVCEYLESVSLFEY